MDEAIVLSTNELKAFYVLEVHGTRKVVKAVNEVSLSIRKNEIYGIAGESGCGKSTLLKTLAANVEPPLRQLGGQVFFHINGKPVDVSSLEQEELRQLRWRFLSYVPQGSMSVLNPVIRLKETYRDFIRSHVPRSGQADAFAMAKRHIVELGLPAQVMDAYPHQLSGGMRQRVTIALAALLSPDVIIADEPTTALDVVVQRGVVQLLKEVQERLNNTIVLVTHDMGVHANVADRIGIMYAGKIVEEAPTEVIFDEPRHPYTQYLINSLPRFGDKTPRESVPGSPPSLMDLPSGCPFHPRCPHVMAKCREEVPQLIALNANHKAACWLNEEPNNGTAA
ncbi:MAG: ABC transporter ATP-binding protein [Anaerolineales bacterium]|nr:ABC transporter ATP-binding protein [Anaerolineales bacterium]MCB8962469.1 ABC transporter ATP-binding protein [Ardenticatenales bacterium]